MNKHLLFLLFLLAACLTSTAENVKIPETLRVKSYTLDNGMSVWINEDHSIPNAYGAVLVKAGSIDCPGTGIAHYFEHMMFKGTSHIGTIDYAHEKPLLDSIAILYDQLAQTTETDARTAIQMDINRLNIRASRYAIPNEFDALIKETGSSTLNAATSYDMTFYYSDFIPAYFEQWAQVNTDRITDPVFRLFQSELETVYEEKNMGENDDMRMALQSIMERFFQGTPYAESIVGTTESLKNPQLNQMAEFYRRYYVANNMCLVISGNVNAEEIMPVIRRTFGSLRRGEEVERPTIAPQPFNGEEKMEVNINIPIARPSFHCWRIPGESHPDALKFKLLSQLLNNEEQTGLLDRLGVENKFAMAQFGAMNMNGAGMALLIVMPNIVGQKVSAAEQIALAAINDIKEGRIDPSFLESCKLSYKKACLMELEKPMNRMMQMVQVASAGKSWEQDITELEEIDRISIQDLSEVARKYLGDNYLHVTKKMASPQRELLNKPPYEKVMPECRDSVSAYARAMKEATLGVNPVLSNVDPATAATKVSLGENATLYVTPNPINDIFRLEYCFRAGTHDFPALDRLTDYLSQLGTKDMSYDAFYGKLQEMGGGISIDNGNYYFSLTITGFDSRFAETVSLATRILTEACGDKKKLSHLKKEEKAGKKMARKEMDELSSALLFKVVRGEKSPYLLDKGPYTDKAMMDLLRQVCTYSCDVLYSGSATPQEVSTAVSQAFDFSTVSKAVSEKSERTTLAYDSPTIYFINKPDAPQAMIQTYILTDVLPDMQMRETGRFFNQYLGVDMTSLMFQEVREFRSLAYSTGSSFQGPSFKHRNTIPWLLNAYVSTQCDKTIEAIHVVDSLIYHTPFLQGKFESKKKEYVNNLINSYPTFRRMADYVSEMPLDGYETDPRAEQKDIIDHLSMDDLRAFHRQHIAGKPAIWCIVGNKSRIDMEALRQFAPIIELKPSDVIR